MKIRIEITRDNGERQVHAYDARYEMTYVGDGSAVTYFIKDIKASEITHKEGT